MILEKYNYIIMWIIPVLTLFLLFCYMISENKNNKMKEFIKRL